MANEHERIRRHSPSPYPSCAAGADAGLDLRQITATHIREELAQRHAGQARDLHHVLRTLFAALKQERLIFHNPMAGSPLSTPGRVPVPLPSDRLRGLLDDLDTPRGTPGSRATTEIDRARWCPPASSSVLPAAVRRRGTGLSRRRGG
jgi:hypothetical protein